MNSKSVEALFLRRYPAIANPAAPAHVPLYERRPSR